MNKPSTSMFPKHFWLLASKELRETYRDSRTVTTLLLMPLLLYPILSLLAYNFIPKPKLNSDTTGFRIAILGQRLSDQILPSLEVSHLNLTQGTPSSKSKPQQDLPPSPEIDKGIRQEENGSPKAKKPIESLPFGAHKWFVERNEFQPEAILALGDADAVVHADPSSGELKIAYNPNSSYSVRAFHFLQSRFINADLIRLKQITRRFGANLPYFQPVPDAISVKKPPTVNYIALIPMVLIMMTITGAVYPAIDLTAGERERGTLETLIASPIPKTSLLLAKFLSVWSVAMLTALVNIASLSITLWVFQLDASVLGPSGLTLSLVGKVFFLLGLFALFFSSLLLLLTSFAQSFKEAQAYLVPLMVFSLAPAMAGLSPAVKLTAMISLVPMVNLVLLTRDLIGGQAETLPATISILSSFLYSLAVLNIASKTFGSDSVLYGTGSWKDFFSKKNPEYVPSTTFAFTILATLFPIQFLLLGFMGRYLTAAAPLVQVITIALATALTFLLTPMAILILGRYFKRNCFNIHWPGLVAIISAVILGVSLWPITMGATWLIGTAASSLQTEGSADWIQQVSQLANKQAKSWAQVPNWILILCLAVTPAVCEELFFRGVLFKALSSIRSSAKSKKWTAILVSAIAFGLFHFITESSIAPLRLFVTTSLGIVLGWVAWQTKSVLPGIFLHGINNAILLQLAILKHQRTNIQISQPPIWQLIVLGLVAVCFVSIGFWLLTFTKKAANETKADAPEIVA